MSMVERHEHGSMGCDGMRMENEEEDREGSLRGELSLRNSYMRREGRSEEMEIIEISPAP